MTAYRLGSVEIDETSLGAASREQEHERQVAIFDLIEDNVFEPVDAPPGVYDLKLTMLEGRLVLDIAGQGVTRRHILSMTPFRSVIKDYFLICGSYYDAIRSSTPQQIETLDMGRRGLHNEGSMQLRDRLAGKVTIDHDTARRLFTLLCALHWRGSS